MEENLNTTLSSALRDAKVWTTEELNQTFLVKLNKDPLTEMIDLSKLIKSENMNIVQVNGVRYGTMSCSPHNAAQSSFLCVIPHSFVLPHFFAHFPSTWYLSSWQAIIPVT